MQGVCYNNIHPIPIMYTEDDTFRKLTQRPFDEVRAMILALPVLELQEIRPILAKNGWTIDEYSCKILERLNEYT